MKTFPILIVLIAICFASCFGDDRVCVERGKRQKGRYLGCFEDHENQRMFRGYLVHQRQANSIESCIKNCHNRRFVFAGVQDGIGCYCGNSEPNQSYHAKISDTKCDKKCPGNGAEKCGGYGAMGVYETGIEQFLVTGKGKIVEDSNIISEVPWKVGSAV